MADNHDDYPIDRDEGTSTRGEPALTVRTGSKPGASLRIKAVGFIRLRKEASIIDAIIPSFKECCVATSGRTTNRCVVIVPSDTSNEIEWEGFFVRGHFKVADKIWDPSLASRFFKDFQPS